MNINFLITPDGRKIPLDDATVEMGIRLVLLKKIGHNTYQLTKRGLAENKHLFEQES